MGQQIEFALRQSMHRVLIVLVSFLPGLLAFLVAVILLSIVGVILSALLRRLLTAFRFDERLTAGGATGSPGLFEWTSTQSPTRLAARVLFWLCVFAGVAIGISAFDASYEANSRVSLFLLPYFTHLVGAAILLIVGAVIARFLARSVLISAVNAQLQYARFLSVGVKWLVLVLTAAMALDHLQIGGAIVSLAFGILFGGIVLTLSLAVGLGSRDLVSRSIERTMERPGGPAEVGGQRPSETQPRSRLRHF